MKHMVRKEYISRSISETAKISKDISEIIAENSLLLINGEMGAGKTTICSQIGSNFGINDLTSSSFQRVTFHRGVLNIVHCDFYRGVFNQDFYIQEIEPQLISPWLLLIEWPSALGDIEDLYYGPIYEIKIEIKDSQIRVIKLNRIN